MARKKTTQTSKKASARGAKTSDGFKLPEPPERSRPREADAKAFVAAGPTRRREKVETERMTIYLPPSVAEELRVRCARERRSLSDAVTVAVAGWLKQ